MAENKNSRRDNGSGTLSKRKDGRWQGAYYVDGKRRYVYGQKGETKNQVAQKLKAAIAKAESGELVAITKQTVAQYMHEWMEDTKKLRYRANSYAHRSIIIRKWIVPHLGTINIQKLNNRHVQRWIAQMNGADLAASTIHVYYAVLHTAMADAVKRKVLERNPCEHVTLPVVEKTEQTILDLEQATLFIQELEGHWLEPIITFALATAMRKAEILSLRWSDIDKSGKVTVRHNVAYIRGQGWVEGPPKTKASERVVPLPAFALDMLKAHRLEQNKRRMAIRPQWEDNDLVFPNSRGGFIQFSTLDRALARSLKKFGLPDVPFHSLRHSAATLLLSLGVPVKVVQEILGHSSIQMTIDIYGHVFPGQREEAMQKLDAAFTLGQLPKKDAK